MSDACAEIYASHNHFVMVAYVLSLDLFHYHQPLSCCFFGNYLIGNLGIVGSQDFLICLLQLVCDQICSDRKIFFLVIILTALHNMDPINYMKGRFAPRYYILVSGKVSLGVCTFQKTEMMALNRL